MPRAETALKQPLVFAPWASVASKEGCECVCRAAAMQRRRFLTLPGTDVRLEKLHHEALQVLQAKQVTCELFMKPWSKAAAIQCSERDLQFASVQTVELPVEPDSGQAPSLPSLEGIYPVPRMDPRSASGPALLVYPCADVMWLALSSGGGLSRKSLCCGGSLRSGQRRGVKSHL